MATNPNLLPDSLSYNPHRDPRLFPELLESETDGEGNPAGPETTLPYHDELRLVVPNEQGGHDILHLEPLLGDGEHIGQVAVAHGQNGVTAERAITSRDYPNAKIKIKGQKEVDFSGQVFAARPLGEPKLVYEPKPPGSTEI